ncbi:MAG: DUF4345 domain-containing protein [Rhodobacter sp.]|nr:DUF4345 domain-containing protein [Rhodobacter sp.]
MASHLVQKIVFGPTGLIGVGFGAMLTFAPATLHATYGISYGPDPSLMSEIRASGAVFLTMSLFVLAGVPRPALAGTSLAVGAGVFLSWGCARVLLIAMDGLPDSGLIIAGIAELVLGVACFAMLRSRA